MKDVSSANFGLLIAYLIPGFVAVWGVSYFSVTVRSWLTAAAGDAPTVGGFLYVTVASVGAGMIVNVLRWLTLDAIHHRTGIRYPSWNFANLQDKLGAYDRLVEFYFRYHEFFGNSLVAGSFTYVVWRFHHPGWSLLLADLGFLLLAALLWTGSRDTLRKYYQRTEQLLAGPAVAGTKRHR